MVASVIVEKASDPDAGWSIRVDSKLAATITGKPGAWVLTDVRKVEKKRGPQTFAAVATAAAHYVHDALSGYLR